MMRWRAIGCIIWAAAGVFLLLGFLSQQAAAGGTLPVNLSGNTSFARFPTIARAPDGTLCAAWSDNRDTFWNIYSTCSADNGRSWGIPGQVYSSAQESLHPALLFSGTVPVLAWTEEISITGQRVFTIYQKMDRSIVVAVPDIRQPVPRPSIALGHDGALHLVFADRRSGPSDRVSDVCYARRPAGSAGWVPATVIFTGTSTGSMDPRISAAPSGVLHVVWSESSPGIYQIRYMTGTVNMGGEVTWSPPITASDIVSLTWQPDVAITPNGDVHIVWTEKVGDHHYPAYTRFNATGGRTPPQRLGGPFQINKAPHLAAVVAGEGEQVCVAWNAQPEGKSEEDIFLICSKDGGNTWSQPENLSRTPAMSIRPSVAVAPDGSVHVVWQELADTDLYLEYRVYYTRKWPYSVYLPLVMRNVR